jgi:signal peptidase I
MVDSILITISLVSIVVWLVQEKHLRSLLQANFNKLVAAGQILPEEQLQQQVLPRWHNLLMQAVSVMWIAWGISVVVLKDGDFAFVLVMLTLLSAVIAGLDKLLFSKARKAYVESKAVVDFLAKYGEEQRQKLAFFLNQDFIVGEYAKSFFPVLGLVLVLRSFIVEPFQIPSASMVPTLLVGDYILVNKYNYGLRLPVLGTKIIENGAPERGDVMVFFPPHKDIYFIKRVIGLPGDQISYKNKQLSINGELAPQIFLAALPPGMNATVELASENLTGVDHLMNKSLRINRGDDFSITVKPGHYWMMGDNRDNSSDSRTWGQVPEERIVGKAFAIWLHWPSITQFPSFSRNGVIQ